MVKGSSSTASASVAEDTTAEPRVAVPRGRVLVAVAVLVLTQLMLVVDTSIVNVALPDIGRELEFTSAGLSWVVTAYALSFGGLILLSGKVGAMIGPKRALLIGLAMFVVASTAGGFASTAVMLVIARAAQGIGAALAAPSIMVFLMNITAPGPQRARAMSLFVLASGSGAALGLLAGGVLTQSLGWEWVMFVNAPIGAFTMIAALRWLPELPRHRTSLDIAGAIASTSAMVALVYAFTTAAESGWSNPLVVSAFVVAALSALALILVERGRLHPVMPLDLFSTMRSAGPLLSMLFIPAGQVGFLFFTTLLTQRVFGFTPLETGLSLIPYTVALIVTNQVIPRMIPQLGERTIGIAGLVGLVLGITSMAVVATQAHAPIAVVLLPSVLLGLGAGAAFAPVTAVIMHQAPHEHLSAVSSVTQGLQQLGAGMGLAVLTGVLADNGGIESGLPTTLLAAAAFPLTGLLLFGFWGRRLAHTNTA
ncbi:drug resistance transporter, EmrB/QacA subfamily [Lentzea jiangxiensis]|uniref:Drug resistance transporter, EmrB/QacA subfamily n=1 Tax=Lentzea jiangxiensis TaxID=641025 RepID=A0A1H0WY39_9PSEU|nr:drug resistance transporter, EmrB/QacA subfamily [Lentzea jiangxiensis]